MEILLEVKVDQENMKIKSRDLKKLLDSEMENMNKGKKDYVESVGNQSVNIEKYLLVITRSISDLIKEEGLDKEDVLLNLESFRKKYSIY